MAKKTGALVRCIHGMYFRTCALCREKTEEDILKELKLQQDDKGTVVYDYQETLELDDVEQDLDYDLED